MSLTHYLFNDSCSGIGAFDRFFDDAFHPQALLRVQDKDNFKPRSVPEVRPHHGRQSHRCTTYRMDVHFDKDTNNVNVTFELPGLQKGDVSIDVRNDVLTVSGEDKTSSERTEGGYVIRERRYGKFSRSLSLPQGLKVGTSVIRV
jgi:HSP20 family protein